MYIKYNQYIYTYVYIFNIYIYMYIKYNQYIYLYIYIQYIPSDFMWRILNLFIIRQNVLNRVKVMELFYGIYLIDLFHQYRAWLFYECWKSLILSIDEACRGRRNKLLTTDLQGLAKIGKLFQQIAQLACAGRNNLQRTGVQLAEGMASLGHYGGLIKDPPETPRTSSTMVLRCLRGTAKL